MEPASSDDRTSSPDVLRVAAAQLPNVVGDLSGNADRVLDAMAWAEEQRADVLVLPELTLTGYPLDDLVLRREFVEEAIESRNRVAEASGSVATVLSTIDVVPPRRGRDTRSRTVAIGAALLCDGAMRGVYRKTLLPSYEVFDETRNFVAGTEPDAVWRIGECVAGVCICEDAWSDDGPPEAQSAAGARILLVPNASPFHREKPRGRLALASKVARRNGVPFVYVNCVGGQDHLVFDGGSIVVDAQGELLYRAEQFSPSRFCLDVPLGRPRPSPDAHNIHTRIPPRRDPRPPGRPREPDSNVAQVWQALVIGTRDFVRRNGATEAVLGLSGGIDAAVTAAVAAEALGPDNVLGLAMPGPRTVEAELQMAQRVGDNLGIGVQVIDLREVLGTLTDELAGLFDAHPARETHIELNARARGAVVMAIADELGHLALATSNKSELSIGTAASFGDMAGEFAPLSDCPKTLVYELARHRNQGGEVIPAEVLARETSLQYASEGGLPSYEVLDEIVERYVEGQGLPQIVAAGFGEEVVRGVLQLIDDAEFARRLTPPGVKITARTYGADRRMPIANAWRPYRREQQQIAGGLTVSASERGEALPPLDD